MNKYTLVQLVWIVTLLVLLLFQSDDQQHWVFLIWALGISCILTGLIIGPKDLMFYTSIYVFLQYVYKPYALANEYAYDNVVTQLNNIWSDVVLFQIYGFACYFIMYSFARKKHANKIIEITQIPSINFIYSSLIIVWLVRFSVLMIPSLGSLFGKISDLTSVLVAAIFIYVCRKESSKRKSAIVYLLVFLALDTVWCMITKTKLPIMMDLLAIIVTRAYFVKKPIKLLYYAVFGVVALFMLGLLQKSRDPVLYGGMNGLDAGLKNITERSDTFNTAVRVFYYTPDYIPFWGKKMLTTLLETTLIPFPYPGKAYFPVGRIVGELYYGYSNVYKGLGLATSWYVTAGSQVWAIVLMGIMGLVVGKVINGLLRNNWWSYSCFLIMLINFSYIERSYFDIINQTTKTCTMLLLFYVLWILLLRKSKRSELQRGLKEETI